uniref:Uncharacterized protein n=1 Tax=Aegilops tauschii subsp. strangulata TaxID=200361 RepID=A0A453G1Y4_AEGTS
MHDAGPTGGAPPSLLWFGSPLPSGQRKSKAGLPTLTALLRLRPPPPPYISPPQTLVPAQHPKL